MALNYSTLFILFLCCYRIASNMRSMCHMSFDSRTTKYTNKLKLSIQRMKMIWPFGRYVIGAGCSPYIVSSYSSTVVHRPYSHNIIARRIIKPFEQLNMHSGEQLATLCARATWYRYDIRLFIIIQRAHVCDSFYL